MIDNQRAEKPRRGWARYLSILIVVALLASGFAIAALSAARASAPAPTPSAVGPVHNLYLGTVGLTIQTTNPLQYTLVDEYYIVGGVYSFLINYGPNWELEPDLAVSWAQTNTNPSTWSFHLAHNAYFVDPRNCAADANGHLQCPTSGGSFPAVNVKASDVKFTFDYVKANANATSYFTTCVESIGHVDLDPNDPYHVTIVYQGSYAAAMASITCVPILPQYIWASQKVTWTNALPIGSGPFMVRPVGTTFAMVTPPPLILDRNPIWHGKEVQGRQVFADTMYFESYVTSGSMALDLTLGKIDIALGPNSQDYLSYLNGKPGISRQAVYDGFEAEQAINVLTPDLRTYFASISSRPLKLGSTNPVLLNQVVRDAIHMVTNRSKMIANAMGGLAQPGDTLMPTSSPYHISIPAYSPDDKDNNGNPFDFPPFSPTALEQFPDGLDAPSMARTMLVQAGWAFVCSTGQLQTGVEYPLCQSSTGKVGGSMINPLTFRFSTFNTEPWWETAARGVIADAQKAGIQFNLELLNGAQMYNLWYRLDYDVWLWDWVWTPVTDISTFMVVQTCHGIVTLDNDNGFCQRDPVTKQWTFDDMYNSTLVDTNPVTRKATSDAMNTIIYGFASYNLPFYRAELYGMNQVRFTNWVDFNQYRAVPPDVGNSPIMGQVVYPIDEKPPQFTLSNFQGVVGQPVQFSVAAIDPQGGPLNYRWDFDITSEPNGGSGLNADTIPWNDDQGGNTATPTWTYSTPGTYGIALRVSQAGGDFFTVQKATVTISATSSGSPSVTAMTFGPGNPTTYSGDMVTLAGSTFDPNGYAISSYAWNWGDGSAVTTTTGPTASHQYTTTGTFTVTLIVTDNHGLTGSSSTIVPVVANVAPTLAPLQTQAVIQNTNNSFVAFASDLNTRDVLTYSWNFGDGSPTATGNPVYHIYTTLGSFTMTVTVNDGHGHSVSSSTGVSVVSIHNTAPNINSLAASPASSWTTLPVTLSANVSDAEGNALLWQWDFNGDNKVDLAYNTTATAPGEFVLKSETWLYPVAGSYHASLTVSDYPLSGNPKSTSTFVTVTITLNHAPTLTNITLTPSIGIAGQGFSFASTSNDVDGDKLTYTWDFGDGTTLTGTTPFFGGALSTSHSYGANGNYVAVLDVNDGKGGDARKAVLVSVVDGGLLRVTTNPAVPGKIFVDGNPADEWGLTWMKIAPGTHTVSFGDVYGLSTPAPQTVTVTAGATTTVVGNYIVEGSLRVLTNPAVAGTIYINGQASDDWGVWRAALPGSYTIHFGAVAGYAPPSDQVVTVTAGVLTTVYGNYTSSPGAPGPDPSTYGMLRVTTNPPVASQVLINGVPTDEWGLAWVKLAPGTYTVSFTAVYGLTPPAPKTLTISAGATTTYNAVFTVHGSLRVLTSPAVAGTVFVNGFPRNDWGMWQSMAPGTYTVSFGPVAGYITPAPQTAVVTASTLTTITGVYTALALVVPAQVLLAPTVPAPTASAPAASPSAPAAAPLSPSSAVVRTAPSGSSGLIAVIRWQ